MSAVRTCSNCKYAVFQDYGYSSYTVEGTSFYCAKGIHPGDGFDSFYGDAVQLAFAADCVSFEAGAPINMDVDGDDMANLNDEQRRIYDGGPPYSGKGSA